MRLLPGKEEEEEDKQEEEEEETKEEEKEDKQEEKEQNIIQMEKLNMKVILLMMYMKEMENIYLKMVNILQQNLKMV